ncbi:MAG: type I-E CRISPR-associated protein Cse1/CasA [Clostridia bacterium]|nr:type I-E CRISPR-associated protein Cse1/CasA [Clostridia bacterium]
MISVLDDGLFRVTDASGETRKVGLRALLAHAHEFSDICGRTQTGRIALLRLCVAFLEDVYRPKTRKDRKQLLEQGCFDMARVEAYISECNKDAPRFDLDDAVHPFMQMAFDPEIDTNADKPVSNLFFDRPAGNAHIHFDHRPIETIAVDAMEALEGMLETYMFCTPMAQGYPSAINNRNPVYTFVRGKNLFHTLVLNMMSERELGNIPFGAGMVPWRLERSIVPKETVASVNYLEAMTWQPRRLTLTFDEDGMVRRIYLQQGKNFIGDGRWRDPWVPFRRMKDGGVTSIKPELGRGLWRDAGNIVAAMGNESLVPVPIINVIGVCDDISNDIIPIEAIGLITDKIAVASILGIVHEEIRIPETLLEDTDKAGRFREWIALSEEIHGVTTRIIGGDYLPDIAGLVGEAFLRNVHDVLFGASLNDLIAAANVDEYEAANRSFGDALFNALRDSLRGILEETGTSVENIKRQNAVESKAMGYCVKRLKEGNMR